VTQVVSPLENYIYRREGDFFHPTEWAGSPWSLTSQHGGPVNALFMQAAEGAALEANFQVARLTVDLFKPVPLAPLQLTSLLLRRGRRLIVMEMTLSPPDGAAVCSARAVLLAAREDVPSYWESPGAVLPGPEGLDSTSIMPDEYRALTPPGFHWSIEIRMTENASGGVAWMTTPLDLVEGTPMSPLQRCAAVSDLTFGVGSHLFPRPTPRPGEETRGMLINTDTTLHLERPPKGRWFAFAEAFLTDRAGVGLSQVTLHDAAGRLGRASQTLLANGNGA